MRVKRISRNLGVDKVMPVCVILFCGFILTTGSELRAQESRDLPSKPEATAAIVAQNDSAFGASDNGAIGAPVISAQSLTFRERVKIYEHSFIEPESLIGPALGAGHWSVARHAAGMGTRS